MLLYKDKGPFLRNGGTYDFKAFNEDEIEEALKGPWFLTLVGVETGTDPITKKEKEEKIEKSEKLKSTAKVKSKVKR